MGILIGSFVWEKGSINDNIRKYLKAKNIDYRYDHFGDLTTSYGKAVAKHVKDDVFNIMLV